MRGKALALTIVCTAIARIHPSSAETLVGPYPFAVGDKFVFAYTATDTFQTGEGTPSVTTTSYTEYTEILAAIKYSFPPSGGTVTAYPVQTTATWDGKDGTYTLKSIEYRNFVASGKVTNYLLYGYTSTTNVAEPNDITLHNAVTRVYGTAGILDALPEATGAKLAEPVNWTQATDNYFITESGDSNVLTSKYVSQTSGAYTDSGMNYDVPYSIVQKAGGTGTSTIGPSTSQEQWSFGLPEKGASGEIIPVTVTFEGKTGVNDAKDWYPGGAAVPYPLIKSSAVDKGAATVPAGCGKYAGDAAQQIELTYTQLATVSGYYFKETDDYYIVDKVGRACELTKYTRKNYDSQVTGDETSVETFSSSRGLMSETVK